MRHEPVLGASVVALAHALRLCVAAQVTFNIAFDGNDFMAVVANY